MSFETIIVSIFAKQLCQLGIECAIGKRYGYHTIIFCHIFFDCQLLVISREEKVVFPADIQSAAISITFIKSPEFVAFQQVVVIA